MTTLSTRYGRGARPAPVRRASASPLRRACLVALVCGSALAVAAASGPAWSARLGVVVAVAAAVVACACAWRELSGERRRHAAAMLRAMREHGAVLREDRARNAAVVDALTARSSAAGRLVERLRARVGELEAQVSALRAERAHLLGRLRHQDTSIATLRGTVRAQEAELAAARVHLDAAPAASVHPLPRRSRGDGRGGEGVVDRRTLETAMVLPNYEPDLRVG